MTTTIDASPTKLRSGAWGAKVRGSVSEGDAVRITTRAGKSWDARVAKVVWSGDGISIVATESLDRGARTRRGTWTGCACGSVEEYERESDCTSCRHDRY